MTHSLYITTTESGSGKALAALGILDLVLRKTTRVHFFRPVIQAEARRDEDINLILTQFGLNQTYEESFGLSSRALNELLGQHRASDALEQIIARFKALEQRGDFVLCEGSDYLGEGAAFEFNLNQEIARNLGCPILILGRADGRSHEEALQPIQLAVDAYRAHHCQVMGIVLNKAMPDQAEALKVLLHKHYGDAGYVLAVIPEDPRLSSPRIRDIADQLQAEVLYGHSHLDSLATHFLVAAMQMQHALTWLQDHSLVITPGDRGDMIVGMLQAHQSIKYPQLAGLLLSTGFKPEPAIATLIEGLPDPLPILSVNTDTYTTASRVREVHSSLIPADTEKISLSIRAFDDHVDLQQLEQQISTVQVKGITPKMFTYNLLQQAKSQPRQIVLPEGADPRILKAAAVLLSRGIVNLTLLGRPDEIDRTIKQHGIQLDVDALSIIFPPESDRLEAYAQTLHELRQHKGITLEAAHDYLVDVSYFGTMMVYKGDADGMVSGAVHTTQHTVRPALQIIKAKPGFSIVSSVFLMCLDDRVLVYGDCAVNPNPTAAELAEIAITSADTAQAFGIAPRVALLSYSSGDSGQGDEVEKVRQATQIAQARRPDLLLEGPMQYDAAVNQAVAAQKLPDSVVAGQATVLVFPDLNTGNNTYKAVQRETGAIAIGPILQGLKKPVNDLSRGCTVEDIINTVAITAIQAQTSA
jgi:phosphate acetyltransferase